MSASSVRSSRLRVLVLVLALLGSAGAAQAQPFGARLNLLGPTHGYAEIPHSPDLNPTGALTVEVWVSVLDANGSDGCSSIVGKNWERAWWLGLCGTKFRSYIKGFVSGDANRNFFESGTIPTGQWTHLAVVFTGSQRQHYINGELVGTKADAGPLITDTDPVRIGSDVSWEHTPLGAIDEVRIWNVARTQEEIRKAINLELSSAPGLVSSYHFSGGFTDSTGGHNGTAAGTGTAFLTFPVTANCGSSSPTRLCLNNRFSVGVRSRVGAPGTPEVEASTVSIPNTGSGLFWFFDSDNWELMVKSLDGCGLNNRYWVFSAATTDVFYRMEVNDVRTGTRKIYFNYPGSPAPAVTDTDAFSTCP